MARSMWNGTLGFGLVNVPVELVTAGRDLGYHFRELHAKDGAPIRHQRFCPEHETEVSRDEVGRGYELDDGSMVVLTDEELEAADPERSRTIEIESFVPVEQIDPVHFDHAYYLVPRDSSKGTLRSYDLLTTAMRDSGLAAVSRFVMRTREYLAAIRGVGGVLALSTMYFPDEVRPLDEVPAPGEESDPDAQAVEDMVAVIGDRYVEWDPESYTDCYRERLGRVIDSKRRGRRVRPPTPEADEEQPVPDLMAALKKTLEQSGRKGRRSRGRSRPLSSLSREELYERARQRGLKGRSKMNKSELATALESDSDPSD